MELNKRGAERGMNHKSPIPANEQGKIARSPHHYYTTKKKEKNLTIQLLTPLHSNISSTERPLAETIAIPKHISRDRP